MNRKIITKAVPVDGISLHINDFIHLLQTGSYRFIFQQGYRSVAVLLSLDDFENYLDLSESDPPDIQNALAQSEDDYANGRVDTLDNLYQVLKPLDA